MSKSLTAFLVRGIKAYVPGSGKILKQVCPGFHLKTFELIIDDLFQYIKTKDTGMKLVMNSFHELYQNERTQQLSESFFAGGVKCKVQQLFNLLHPPRKSHIFIIFGFH